MLDPLSPRRMVTEATEAEGDEAADGLTRIPLLASLRLAMQKPAEEAQTEVVEILRHVAREMTLPQVFPCALTERPARYCLYQGERFTLNIMAWRQGQVGTLRGQLAWSAYTVLRGELVESRFALGGGGGASAPLLGTACRMVGRGDVSVTAADEGRAYRLANLGLVPALSLHIETMPEARWPAPPPVFRTGHMGGTGPLLRLLQ